MTIRALAVLLGLLCSFPAFAADGLTASEAAQEVSYKRLASYQSRLIGQLNELGKRIARLKVQRRGVGRDVQLKNALRESQALAKRLTGLRGKLRRMGENLLATYDAAISRAKTAELRAQLGKRKAAHKQAMAAGARTGKLFLGGKTNPLDGPDELEEKADLLADSQERLEKKLAKLRRRIRKMEHQRRLRRHGRAARDNPFVEEAPQRVGVSRTTSTSVQPGAPVNDPSNKVQAAAPPSARGELRFNRTAQGAVLDGPVPNAITKNPSSSLGINARAQQQSVRSLDPGAFRTNMRLGISAKSSLSELKRAERQLKALTAKLSKEAAALRHKAKKMRKR